MKNLKKLIMLLIAYAFCETSRAKHVDLKFHPLSAKEVYEILEQANLTAAIPAGRIITEGIMAETKTLIKNNKSRKARILTFGSSSGESQTVLQEICFSSRSLKQEESEQPQGRQATSPTDTVPTTTTGSGTGTDTATGTVPTVTICGAPIPTPITTTTGFEPPISVPPTPSARGFQNNDGNSNELENGKKEDSNEQDEPQGRQAPATTIETSPPPPDQVIPSPPGTPAPAPPSPPTTPTSCFFPSAPPPPTSTSTPVATPGPLPTATTTQTDNGGGGVNCIKLEKPIRR